jgi:hypothetical protein
LASRGRRADEKFVIGVMNDQSGPCRPNGVALMRLLIRPELDGFFFITADYAFGASLEADARDAIAKAGGTVVGGVRSPLNTADFSSYLMRRPPRPR